MKKIALVLSVVLCLSLCFVGCSPAELNPSDYVTLGAYQGLTIGLEEKIEVTEEDVETQIKADLSSGMETITITDRACKNEDTVKIDFEGKVDGKAFAGGSSKGYSLKLGSGSMIPGFEEAIVGHKTGETFDINVTFPKDYGNPETEVEKAKLNGKDAVFTITIHEITSEKYPELTDAYVKAAFGVDSVAQYRKNVKENLLIAKEEDLEQQREELVWEAAVKNATFSSLPENEVNAFIDNIISQYDNSLAASGSSFAAYLSMIGSTEEAFRKEQREGAENYVKRLLITLAVAEKENLMPTTEEYIERGEKIAATYGYGSLTEMELSVGKTTILRELMLMEDVYEVMKKDLKVTKPTTTAPPTTTTTTTTTTTAAK